MEQCVCSAIAVVDSATFLVTVLRVDEWGRPFASVASNRVTCKHSARETRGGRCCLGGHLRQCTPSSDHSRRQRAPYGRSYRVVNVQGPARHRLKCKLRQTAHRGSGPSFWGQTQGGRTCAALGIRLVTVNHVSKVSNRVGCRLRQTAVFVRSRPVPRCCPW